MLRSVNAAVTTRIAARTRRRLPALGVALALLVPTAGPAAAQLGLYSADIAVELDTSYDDDLHVRVRNNGPDEAWGTAEVTLPDGLVAVDLPTGCTGSGARITCTTDPLLAGWYTTFPVEVVQVERGVQRIDATVTGNLPDRRATNDQASVSVQTLPSVRGDGDVVQAAVQASHMRFPGAATHAVLARADGFADALAGSALTGHGPLLFTAGDGLDPRTAEELDRILPEGGTVYVLGGEAALGTAIVDALSASGLTPHRLAGDTRVTTALAVAEEVRRVAGGHGGTAIIARAWGEGTSAWADSVAVGGVAADTATPILLTAGDTLSGPVADWLAQDRTAHTTVVGGGAAVDDAVLAALPSPVRVAGPDRAGTAAAIAELYPTRRDHSADGFHLVDGWDEMGWAHGLVAAGLAADTDAPVLFVAGDTAPEATTQALTSCRDQPIPLAGVGPVDEAVRADLDELDADACN